MLLSRWKQGTLCGLGNGKRRNPKRLRRGCRSLARRGYHGEHLEPRIVLDSTVVFNEVFYNPAGVDTELEWVELHNQMAVDMDLSGWRIDGGIGYDFAEGSILPGGEYIVVAKNPEALALTSGFADALGPFTGSLSNGGEELVLYNNFRSFRTRSLPDPPPNLDPFDGGLDGRRVMDSLVYGDNAPWPVGPDGSGATLAKVDPNVASNDAANWTTSAEIGGTPGALNFEQETIEEVSLDFVATGTTASVHVPVNDSLGNDWTSADYVQGSRGETWSDEVFGVGFFQGDDGVPYQETVLDDGPLAYWRFSETNTQGGATNLGTLGAAVGGTFAQEAMVGADSLIGQAADHSLSISSLDNESPFVSAGFEKVDTGRTLEFWVSVDSLPSTTINLVGDAESFLDYGMRVQLKSNGRLIVYHKTVSSFLGSFYDSERVLDVGEIVHVVATWDAVTGESQLFLDGVEAARINQGGPSPDTGTTVNTNNPIFVGRDGQGSVSGLARIDEVSIYDYALGADRVAAHYEAGRPTFSGLFQSELANMHQVSSSAYVRKTFTVPENVDINHLTLSVVYDDAFVAYLNGEEVARRNVNGDVTFDSTALSSRTLDDAQQPEAIDLSSNVSLLQPGANILAIHGINVAADDDDFVLNARLAAQGTVIPEEPTPNVVFNEISSASAETFQVELQNDGARPAQLAGFVIAVAGDTPSEFAIGNVVLQPGGQLALSESDLGFRATDGDRVFLYNTDKSKLLDARK